MELQLTSVFAVLAAVLLAVCNTVTPAPQSAPSLFPDAQPGEDWTRVTAPLGSHTGLGFSLLLPPGWTLNELEGIDSYIGEVTGDGVILEFEHGPYSWCPDPEAHPEIYHGYDVSYEEIGGLPALLEVPMDPSDSYTGVCFENMDAPGEILWMGGWGLTPEQQRVAIGIFRSIRALQR